MKQRRDLRIILRLFMHNGRRRLLLGLLLAALTVLAGAGLLGLAGWFIAATAIAGLTAASAVVFDVFMPSAGIRLLAIGRTLSRYGERLVTHDATLAVLAGLREQLFRGWAGPGAARALVLRPARLLFRLTADIDALESVYLRLLVPAGAAFGATLFTALALGWMRPALGLALLLWLPAVGLGIVGWTARRAAPAALVRALALESLRERSVDLVAGQTELAMAGRLPAQRQLLAASDVRLARAETALNRLEANGGAAFTIAGSLTLAGVLLAVAALAGRGSIGVPAAVLALLLALAAMEPFAALRRGALEAARTALAARRVAPRLVAASEPAGVAVPVPGVALQMVCADVRPAGAAVQTLHGVSLHLEQGERVALVGLSGAGKSTLLALVAGELLPDSGGVQALPATWLTQRVELFQDSLRDNLRLAWPGAADEALWAALRDAGLARDVEALAQGLDTPLGEGGLGLSGGQARRLALARLLLRGGDLWLLDEPTEALDAETAHDVLQRLAGHVNGRTLLLATHLRREAALADRLVRLEAGRIVSDIRRDQAGFEQALRALRDD